MHYNVQLFSWTPDDGVHQVGKTVEITAVSPKLAATSLLGLRLQETGASTRLAARVWADEDSAQADCVCFFYQ